MMRGLLWNTHEAQFEGSVEEVDTGMQLKFHSTALTCLGQSFDEAMKPCAANEKSTSAKSNQPMDETVGILRGEVLAHEKKMTLGPFDEEVEGDSVRGALES
jgi:hypothetical protein